MKEETITEKTNNFQENELKQEGNVIPKTTGESKKECTVKQEKEILPQWRQIILETDGNSIRLIKNQTAGNLELISILSGVINIIQNQGRK